MSVFEPSDDALNITLLLIPESSMMSLASVLDVMRAANRISRRTLFRWTLITLDGQPATLTCGLPIHPDGPLTSTDHNDILIVIGGFNTQRHVDKNSLIRLRTYMRKFKVVGGIESGSWIMARAGRLNGRNATTHWEDLDDFATSFPQVKVKPHRYVIDENVFTVSGASPSFDFMLHLIRVRYGYHLSLEVASVFIYDGIHTGNDSQPVVSLGELEHHEPRLAQAIRLMEQHLEDTLPITLLARQSNISPRTLTYLFQRNLQLSPGQFYLRLRLKAAKRLVLDTRLTIQEIAIRTGFNSLAAFSRQFKRYYQITASECRKGKAVGNLLGREQK